MQEPQQSESQHEPTGKFDSSGELYLPPEDDFGSSPGGGLGGPTTSGTTGRILPPGAEDPMDDK